MFKGTKRKQTTTKPQTNQDELFYSKSRLLQYYIPPFKVNHDLASPAFTGIKQRGMELMEGGNRMRMERKVYVRVEIHQRRGRR